ncbi:MAG: hypothetical protein E6I52_05840 [Chloroflexi bacterium]|nr:MAG: hypothetical protein E6I52_05840 [Chloroflexota bacterium]
MSGQLGLNSLTAGTLGRLQRSDSALSESIRKLSSGLRITQAADDAAGLSMAVRLRAQVRGWQMGQRNAQDMTSLLQTADGAMGDVTAQVQRIRELAVQAANGTQSTADRQAIQQEIASLQGAVQATVDGAEFNGIKLLGGQLATPAPTVDVTGILGGVSGNGTSSTASGTYQIKVTQAPRRAAVVGDQPVTTIASGPVQMTISGAIGSKTLTFNTGDSPATMVATINAQSATTGVQALITDATTTYDDGTQVDPFGDGYLYLRTVQAGSGATVTVSTTGDAGNDHTGFGLAPVSNTGQDLQGEINGVPATAASGGAGFTLTAGPAAGGANGLTVTLQNPPAGAFQAALQGGTYPAPGVTLGNITVTAFAPTVVDLQLQAMTGPSAAHLRTIDIAALTVGAVSIGGAGTLGSIDVTTEAGAAAAIALADAALVQLAAARGKVGASTRGMESALTRASDAELNHIAAVSRIEDADIASELSSLVRAHVLQQAGLAVLAQANVLASSVLDLLRPAAALGDAQSLYQPSQV